MEDKKALEQAASQMITEREDASYYEREFNSSEAYEAPPVSQQEAEEIERTFFDTSRDLGAMVLGAAPRNINRATLALKDLGAFAADVATGEKEEEDEVQLMRKANLMWRQYAKVPEFGVKETEEGEPESNTLGIMQDIGDYLVRFMAGAAATPGPGYAKAIGGLGVAAFTSDNEDMSLLESVANMLPDGDENAKALKDAIQQDPSKPDEAVIRRGIKAAEDIGLGLTVDKAVGAAAEAIGKPALAFLGEVPGVLTGAAARAFVGTKNFLSGSAETVGKVTIKQVEKGNLAEAGMDIKFDASSFDPERSIDEQLGKLISVDAAGDGPKITPEAQEKVVGGIKKKIVEIIEEGQSNPDSPVFTAYQQQVRDTAARMKVSKKKAEEITKKKNSERLNAVAEQQAANIYFDTVVARFSSNAKAANKARQAGNNDMAGMLQQRANDRLDEMLQTALPFYQSVSGTAGAVLRQTQEIGEKSRRIIEMMKGIELDDVKAGSDALEAMKNDPEARRELVDRMARSVDLTTALGGTAEDSAAAIAKALGKVGKGETNAKKMWKAFESSYINGILSSPKTHLLNFTSSQAMALGLIAERGIASAVPGSGVKLKEATTMFNEFMRSNVEGVIFAANGATAAARAGFGKGFKDRYRVNVKSQKDILLDKGVIRSADQFATPAMTRGERGNLMSVEKFEEGLEPSAFSGAAFNQTGTMGKTIDYLGTTIGSGWVRDMMAYQDNFVKSMMVRGEQRAFINRKVYDEDALGLSELIKNGKFDEKKVRKQVEEIVARGGEDFNFESRFHELGMTKKQATSLASRAERLRLQSVEEAAESALTSTFQKRLGPKMEQVRKTLQDTVPGGRLFVPFVTTPVNLISEQLKRMPVLQAGESAASVGLPIHPQFYKDFAAGGRRRAKAVAQFTTGNALFMLGAKMYDEGELTPALSSASSGERQFLSDMGLQEMSLKSDDATFSFMQYAPIAPVVLAGAQMRHVFGEETNDIIRGLNDDDFNEFKTKYLGLISNQAMYMNDLPLLQGPSDIFKLVTQAERGNASLGERASEFVARKAAAATPASSMLAWVGRKDDKYLRDMAEFTDYIKDRLPGWRKDLAPSRDALWEKRRLGQDMYGPFAVNVKELSKDPVRMKMMEVGAFPKRPDRTIGVSIDGRKIDVKLTKEQFEELGSLFETPQYSLYPKIAATINSSSFQDATTEEQRNMIMNTYRENVDDVVNDYATMNPEVFEKYNRLRLADELLRNRKGPASSYLGKVKDKLEGKE